MEWIGCTVFEIVAFKLYCDLESGVSGSLKVIGSGTIRSADPENLTLEANISSIGKTVAKLWPFCISKMAVSHHLGFYRTANSVIRSADPKNPSLEPNME